MGQQQRNKHKSRIWFTQDFNTTNTHLHTKKTVRTSPQYVTGYNLWPGLEHIIRTHNEGNSERSFNRNDLINNHLFTYKQCQPASVQPYELHYKKQHIKHEANDIQPRVPDSCLALGLNQIQTESQTLNSNWLIRSSESQTLKLVNAHYKQSIITG